jgi:hypothetical protein
MNLPGNAQNNFFSLYPNPAMLESEANKIGEEIIAIAKTKQPTLNAEVKYTIGPWPTMVGFDATENTGILPVWELQLPAIRTALIKAAGSEGAAKEVFGLFYHGLFIPQPAGQAIVQSFDLQKQGHAYFELYELALIGWFYWRSAGKEAELQQCLEWARKLIKVLPSPMPKGDLVSLYVKENRQRFQMDAVAWLYIQMHMLIDMMENEEPVSIESFLGTFLLDLKATKENEWRDENGN